MKVVLVTHYYPAHRGGVERIAGQLAERLVAPGDLVVEWHASDCDPAPAPLPGLGCVPAASWNVTERRFGFPYPLWSPGALHRLWQSVRQADVVHVHDCLYFGSVIAFLAARLARKPILVTQHVGFIPYRSPLLRVMLAVANRVLGRMVLGGATRVVFESDAVRRYFSRHARFRAEPSLIANGVDTQSFAPVDAAGREALRKALGATPGQPVLLFIGRFVEKKGLPVLRELASRMPHTLWILAGLGPINPEDWGLPNVRVVRAPRSNELAPLYQAADLLVLPSYGEGMPLVVQEAMACGTPALVGTETAAACPPQANAPLLSEPTGVADTAQRWRARLSALLAEPSSLAELRPRVAAFARDNWSWQQCVRLYAALLHDCAAGSRS